VTLDHLWLIAQAFAGLFGLLFGSFMNVCIARMPEDRSVVYPGSACPSCGTAIKPWDNVPVLAWIWLRGRCRACGSDISPLYPLVEALFGVLMVLLFRHVVRDVAWLDRAHLAAFVWYGWLCFAAVALTFIDLRHKIIPDEFSIYSVPVGVGGAVLLGWLGYEGAPTWQQSVVGALVGGGGIAALIGAYWLVRREEGMGFGDAKLLAAYGAWFGAFPGVAAILMIGSILGSIVGVGAMLVTGRGLKLAIPFGPFLAAAAIFWCFFGDRVALHYAGLTG
jgi:leader peptidase (prepilin peptidase)/N-methyltransferase